MLTTPSSPFLLEEIEELRVCGDETKINPIPLGVNVQASQLDQKPYLGTKIKAANDTPEEVKSKRFTGKFYPSSS